MGKGEVESVNSLRFLPHLLINGMMRSEHDGREGYPTHGRAQPQSQPQVLLDNRARRPSRRILGDQGDPGIRQGSGTVEAKPQLEDPVSTKQPS